MFYRTKDALWSVPFAAGHFQEPRKLFEADRGGYRVWDREYAVTGDGTRFLFAKDLPDPEDYRRIQVVLNWPEEVARLLSGGSNAAP